MNLYQDKCKNGSIKPKITFTQESFVLPYIIAPIFLLIAITDSLIFNGKLRNALQVPVEQFFYFSVFLVMPHIMGSTISMVDIEYIKQYQVKLLAFTVVITSILFFTPAILMSTGFILFHYLLAVAHAANQQVGIAKMLTKGSLKCLKAWRFLGTAIGMLAYLGTFFISKQEYYTGKISSFIDADTGVALLNQVLIVLFGMFSWSSYKSYLTTNTKIEKTVIITGVTEMGSIVMLFMMVYPFFWTLISRFIHDVSAFMFYIMHDSNKNQDIKRNLVYRLLPAKIPIAILCPTIAIIAAFPITFFSIVHHNTFFAKIAIAFSLLHYYTEGFIWKRESPTRKYISIK